jgi:hypothetical protein
MKKLIIAVMLAAMAAMGCGGSSPTAPPTPAAAPPPPIPACQANNTGTLSVRNDFWRLEPIDITLNGVSVARLLPYGQTWSATVPAGVPQTLRTFRSSTGAAISTSSPTVAQCGTMALSQPVTTGGE